MNWPMPEDIVMPGEDELADGCSCGDCTPGCANRMFFPCCGACMEASA